MATQYEWWGGPPGPHGSPWTRFSPEVSSACQLRQAGQGAGCGPGGPPYHACPCSVVGKLCGIGRKRLLHESWRMRKHRGTQRNGSPHHLPAVHPEGQCGTSARKPTLQAWRPAPRKAASWSSRLDPAELRHCFFDRLEFRGRLARKLECLHVTESGADASAHSVGRVARLSGNVRQPNHVLGNEIAADKTERRPRTGEEWLAATKYDGVEVKSILINKTKVG